MMLKGEVVGLRAIEATDLPTLLTWRNQPEFRKYFREYRELSFEHQKNWFRDVVMQDQRTIMFSIVRLSDSSLLGACGLCYIDWINRSADFSIYIGDSNLYIDDTYAVDAGFTMMRYGFQELNLHRLWAEIYDFDLAKKRMFHQLGFKQDGCFRDNHWAFGGWHDSLFFGLLSTDEWQI